MISNDETNLHAQWKTIKLTSFVPCSFMCLRSGVTILPTIKMSNLIMQNVERFKRMHEDAQQEVVIENALENFKPRHQLLT